MAHADPDDLALCALGEDVGTDEDRRHVQTCEQCATELAELQRVVLLGRSADGDPELIAPSPRVWARVQQKLDLPSSIREVPVDPFWAVIEAATGPSSGGPELVASATLAPVRTETFSASGRAVLTADALGRRILQVALTTAPEDVGVRYAWLVRRDDPTQMQTLGVLDGAHGVWTVDRSIDLEQYAIVTISQQSAGDVEHSGVDLVQGELTLVG